MREKTLKSFFKHLMYHKTGNCNICGKLTIFLCSDKIVTDRNMVCVFCKSKSRHRIVAKIILGLAKIKYKSLKKLSKKTNLKIYNLDTDDVISRFMKKNKNYFSSGYFPEAKFGTKIKERVYSQNVENLSFNNEQFDIIISEHVFEHVRNFQKGFSEIYRVLKNNGTHIFTIPYNFDQKTIQRVDISTEQDIFILPPEYHGDHHSKNKKILAYRKYGFDLFDMLKNIGFTTEIVFSSYYDFKRNGIIGSFAFISKKFK